jgi:hypothetical protein
MKHILLFMWTAVSLLAADATGKWTGTLTVPTSNGGERPGPAYLILKQEGGKITGTVGPDANERHTIQNGKAENGNLTFEVASGASTMKFALQQTGDEIKGEVTRERDGQTQTARLAVKRDE